MVKREMEDGVSEDCHKIYSRFLHYISESKSGAIMYFLVMHLVLQCTEGK